MDSVVDMKSLIRGSAALGWPVLLSLAVCSSVWAQFAPPSSAGIYAAKVITLSGQVSVLRDTIPWSLNIGDSVQVQQIIITGPDGYAQFEVSNDKSTFEVYPNSRVVFRKNPPNWGDLLDLMVGRVKVHIQKLMGDQPNRNRVHTPTAVISVRGTTFDVAIDDDDDTTLVQVEEGEVVVQHRTMFGEKVLGPGESLHVYKNAPLEARRIDKSSVLRVAARIITDGLYTMVYRTPRVGSGGTGPGSSGDTGGKHPKPPVGGVPPPPGGVPPPPH